MKELNKLREWGEGDMNEQCFHLLQYPTCFAQIYFQRRHVVQTWGDVHILIVNVPWEIVTLQETVPRCVNSESMKGLLPLTLHERAITLQKTVLRYKTSESKKGHKRRSAPDAGPTRGTATESQQPPTIQRQRRGISAAQLLTQAQQGAQPQSPNSRWQPFPQAWKGPDSAARPVKDCWLKG